MNESPGLLPLFSDLPTLVLQRDGASNALLAPLLAVCLVTSLVTKLVALRGRCESKLASILFRSPLTWLPTK